MSRVLAVMIVLGVLQLTGFPSAGSAAPDNAPIEAKSPPRPHVKVDGGFLSVDVRAAPLSDVLRAISEQTAIAISLHGRGEERITQSFAGIGLDEGIQRLARGYNVVFVYALPSGPSSRDRLVEVRVYEASTPVPADASTPASTPQVAMTADAQRAAQLQAVKDLARNASERQPEALTLLSEMLARDADPAVRQNAALSLGTIPGPEAARALTAALGDQDASVRAGALSSLGKMQDEGLAGTVAQVVAQDPDPSVRRVGVWVLSAFQSDDVRRQLQAAASDPDPEVRDAATRSIRRLERQAGVN